MSKLQQNVHKQAGNRAHHLMLPQFDEMQDLQRGHQQSNEKGALRKMEKYWDPSLSDKSRWWG